jgi:lipoprotein-anchoring transpeptidase ErfK/SrfK
MQILINSMGLTHCCRRFTSRLLLIMVLGSALGSPVRAAPPEPTTPSAPTEINPQPTTSPQPPTSPKLPTSPKPATSPIAKKMAALKKSNQRWIEVNLSKQRLFAWEGKKQVHAVVVSTGKASTPTLPGIFSIQDKYQSLTLEGDDYVVPDVPSVMFYSGGYAIHGAYWHNKFGTPLSHGCVNVALDHAEWLFNWAAIGTPVVVHD